MLNPNFGEREICAMSLCELKHLYDAEKLCYVGRNRTL